MDVTCALASPVDPLHQGKPEIGQHWLVPFLKEWPIFGELHADGPPIVQERLAGIPHFHVDYRFLGDDKFAELETIYHRSKQLIAVFADERVGEFCMKVIPYRRHWPEWLRINRLLTGFQDVKLDLACMKCPHKQTYLGDLVPRKHITGERMVLCPAHGLAWSLKDGRNINEFTE